MYLSSISIELGTGILDHNNRKFIAENVDRERTKNNEEFKNISLEEAYHILFDNALQSYNDRQKRADRKIDNYLEHIQKSKQEKPFYEIIVQVGNQNDMGIGSRNEPIAKAILEDYMLSFEKQNPYLFVFNATLHMDEATPHLHIDFVPFTTGSKRGLDTRVSLKQALASQGFKGGTRGDTEWNQWVSAEKSALAFVMERHGIEWEHKGTHEKHLSVLDYKKQERTAELEQLGAKIEEKQAKFNVLSERVLNYDDGLENLKNVDEMLDNAPEYQLSEPQGFMSAKAYKTKIAEPLIQKLKALVKTALARCFEGWDNYHRLNITNGNLYRENEMLSKINSKLKSENKNLRSEVKDYKLLRKVFGHKQIDKLLEQARNIKGRKRENPRSR